LSSGFLENVSLNLNDTPSLKDRQNQPPTVMVFDSGVGGLSVCQSILSLCPNVRIVYVADNAAFPYGTKTDGYLRERIVNVLSKQCITHQPDMLVIACNTASTLVLPDLRERLNIPVVGVVPAIKPAALETRTGAIGLLATSATVQRSYTDQLISDFAPHCDVVRVGSSRLVEIAEEYLRGLPVSKAELADITRSFFCESLSAPVDKIVLGCTHFPLLRSQLSESSLKRVEWIDSGDAIAQRVKDLLESIECKQAADITHRIMFTGDDPTNKFFEAMLYSLGFKHFELIE
jgi:glutamate racemase